MRNRVLQALSGITWEMDKETIITTYKITGLSLDFILERYTMACARDGAEQRLTYSHRMSSVEQLNEKFRKLLLRKHNELLTKQYLIACYLSSQPNNHIVMDVPTPRRIRHDFRTFNIDIIHLMPTIVDLRLVREALRSLHQMTHPPPFSDTFSATQC